MANSSAASNQMERANKESPYDRVTISTKSKQLVSVALFKASIKALKEIVSFYKVSEKGSKNELARSAAKYAWIGTLFDSTRVTMLGLNDKLAAKNARLSPFLTINGLRLVLPLGARLIISIWAPRSS